MLHHFVPPQGCKERKEEREERKKDRWADGWMWYLVAPEGQIQGLLTRQVGSRGVVWDVIVFIWIHGH